MVISLLAALTVTGNVNLLRNGDFSQGNVGFRSEYTFSDSVLPEGTYTVGFDPRQHHSGAATMGDHTTGRGKMLIANGSSEPGMVVWAETVRVAPHHLYVFTGYAASWGDDGSGLDPSPARLVVTVDGTRISMWPASPIKANDGWWTQFRYAWDSGSHRLAEIKIADVNTVMIGNDFALDDLSFLRKHRR